MRAKKKAEKPKDSEPKKLLARVRERFKVMTEADQENRRLALEDLKFLHVPGSQWDENQKKERGQRPCYEFNKLRVTTKRVVNDMRANRPQGKARAVEDGDKDTADTLEGLIRNIWNVSDGDTVIDYAAEYQVGGGMGAWRVNTEYGSDSTFEQDIKVEAIKNPFCLYADPTAADPLKRDADDWILTEKISKKAYEARYPKAEIIDFDEVEFDDDEDWSDGETVRICEYWYKVPSTKTVALLSDGKTVDVEKTQMEQLAKQGITVVRTREVKCDKIMMLICSGESILEGPKEWAGKHFPFIQIYGEWFVIDGKVYWHGLARFGKDAQRSYNVSRTAITETIAMAPQSKFWATAEQAKGHTDKWAVAHKELMPFMLFNADPKNPGEPKRMGGPDVPVALMQEAQIASEEIKAVTGIFDASLGAQSNETSGKAITARKQQGEIANFNFADNMAKGIRRTWEVLIDLIPKVYDTERSVRILGVDGAEKYVKINTMQFDPATGTSSPVNDLTRGKYDVTVTTGPSFSTQRQEASEMYMQLMQSFPQAMGVAGDLVFKSLDLPYAEQIAERMRALLPPAIQQTIAEGKPVPPEVQAVMQQAEQAMAQVQEQGQMLQQAAQEVEQGKAAIDKGKAELQTLIANLKTEEARFEAKVAKEIAKIQQKEAEVAMKETQATVSTENEETRAERERLVAESQQSVQTIQMLTQDFLQMASQLLTQLSDQAPKRKQIRAKRVNGELVAQIEEFNDAGQMVGSRDASVRREGDMIVGEA